VLLPYFERALPATILIAFVLGFAAAEVLLRRYVNVRPLLIWFMLLLGLLALAGALRGWPWPMRLVLHAAWLFTMGLLVVLLRTGVLMVHFE
jgi:uncharacterized membrane protein YoaK (UPF0700 family)